MFEKALEIQPGHRRDAGGADRPLHRRRRLRGGDQAEARADQRRRPRQLDEKFTLSASRSPAIYKDKLNNPQKAIAAHLEALEPQAGRSRAAARPAGAVQRDQAVEEGDGDPASSWPSWRAAQVKARFLVAAGNIANYELHSTDEAVELYNQAPRRGPGRPEGLRADRQDHDREEGLEEPGAQLPQDDQAARHGAGAREEADGRRAVARAGRDLPVAPQGLQVGDRGLRGLRCSWIRTRSRATRSSPSCTSCRARRPTSKAIKSYRQLIKATHRLRSDGRLPRRRCASCCMELRQYDKAWCVAAAAGRSCARATPRRRSSTSSTSPRCSRAPARGSPRTCGS